MTSASPASTRSTARRRPWRRSSGAPPDTFGSSGTSLSVSPSRVQADSIRSRCSDGDTKLSPSPSSTRETRTTPTARRLKEDALVTEGEPAPDFTLTADSGEPVSLSSFRGRSVVLYFYPKDDTPGCTTEACEFRDAYDRFQEQGVEVIGVSPDAAGSHRKFKEIGRAHV